MDIHYTKTKKMSSGNAGKKVFQENFEEVRQIRILKIKATRKNIAP